MAAYNTPLPTYFSGTPSYEGLPNGRNSGMAKSYIDKFENYQAGVNPDTKMSDSIKSESGRSLNDSLDPSFNPRYEAKYPRYFEPLRRLSAVEDSAYFSSDVSNPNTIDSRYYSTRPNPNLSSSSVSPNSNLNSSPISPNSNLMSSSINYTNNEPYSSPYSSRQQPSSLTSLPPLSKSYESSRPFESSLQSSKALESKDWKELEYKESSPLEEKGTLPGRKDSNSSSTSEGSPNFLKLARLNLQPVKYRLKKLCSLGKYE